MSTRGLWGFYKENAPVQNKLTYNHNDSYPGWLGDNIVHFCRQTSTQELNEIFDKIIMVNKNSEPTWKQIAECCEFANLSVNIKSIKDWYCLLRESQGLPESYKGELKYMIDNSDFIKDSLFCEWAYIINLTTNKLEIYQGHRTRKNRKSNRYKATKPYNGYYACEMLIQFDLNNLPYEWFDLVEDKLEKSA